MSNRTKRFLIVLILFGVLAGAAWAELATPARPLFAQEDTTPTITPTPTGTPTLTPTPTGTTSLTPSLTPTWTPTFFFTPTPTWTPPFPINSPLVSPTATKPIRIVTEISHPQSGDAVSGFTPILGTALMTAYRRYELAISPAGMENWQTLFNSMDVKHDDQLYVIDTTQFPDGYYDLRLRTINDTGEYIEGFLRGMEIRNANPPTVTPAFDESGALIPPLVSPLATPTPTPRPRIIQFIPDGQGIFNPEVGDTVSNFVDIIGTAVGYYQKPFERYEMAISPAGEGAWNWLYGSDQQVWQDVVYTLNTRDFADGYYDVRLRIVYRDANYDDFILRYLNIANAGVPDVNVTSPNGIDSPTSCDAIGGIVDFVGTAAGPEFVRWEMAWSPSGTEQWSWLTGGDTPVVNQVLARLDVNSLVNDEIDVRLRIVKPDGNYEDHYVGNLRVLAPTPTPTPPLSPLPGENPTLMPGQIPTLMPAEFPTSAPVPTLPPLTPTPLG